MIIGLDSATPPTTAQALAAKLAGIGLWNGYLSEIPQRDGIYRPWSEAEFNVVKLINPHPIAFTSGWDNPVAARQDALRQGLRLCLDVERLIRDDGPWVQGWLDAAAPVGLYGVRSVHVGRRAAFHIAAWYPGADPRTSYPVLWPQPGGLCGWQWQNTHTEFGVPVDRGWYDNGFVQGETMAYTTDDIYNELRGNEAHSKLDRILSKLDGPHAGAAFESSTLWDGATVKDKLTLILEAIAALPAPTTVPAVAVDFTNLTDAINGLRGDIAALVAGLHQGLRLP